MVFLSIAFKLGTYLSCAFEYRTNGIEISEIRKWVGRFWLKSVQKKSFITIPCLVECFAQSVRNLIRRTSTAVAFSSRSFLVCGRRMRVGVGRRSPIGSLPAPRYSRLARHIAPEHLKTTKNILVTSKKQPWGKKARVDSKTVGTSLNTRF